VPLHSHDVVVIGGGLAGLRAAIAAHDAGRDVAIVSKVHPLRSHSVAAQGGINAALAKAPGGENDRWEDHAFDTVKGSDYLADQDAAEILCTEVPAAVFERYAPRAQDWLPGRSRPDQRGPGETQVGPRPCP